VGRRVGSLFAARSTAAQRCPSTGSTLGCCPVFRTDPQCSRPAACVTPARRCQVMSAIYPQLVVFCAPPGPHPSTCCCVYYDRNLCLVCLALGPFRRGAVLIAPIVLAHHRQVADLKDFPRRSPRRRTYPRAVNLCTCTHYNNSHYTNYYIHNTTNHNPFVRRWPCGLLLALSAYWLVIITNYRSLHFATLHGTNLSPWRPVTVLL